MRYTQLGSTGIEVSTLCMGTMTFAREADEAMSARLFDRCREVGINFFDTADIYTEGASERCLGKIIANHPREELVISSKVGMKCEGGLAPKLIAEGIEDSLRNLRTDYLDVYFCHKFDDQTPVEDTLRALDKLVQAGKIRCYGVSNWAAWQVARALGDCGAWGITPPQVLQPMYNLAKRTVEIEIFPMALAEKLGVIAYSPLGGGLLTGKYAGGGGDEGRLRAFSTYSKRYADKMNYEIAERLTTYARERGVSAVTLAIAWAGKHPAMTAPIIGARNLEQLEPALAAASYEMTDVEWEHLASLTPPVPLATDRAEEVK